MRRTEATNCKTNNVGSWRAFTVANDALTVVVSRDNTWATCLTVAELKKIWEPGSKVNNWRDVRASFPNEPLRLFGPGTDSGTFEYFTEAINGRARASRSDYQASEDDNVLVQGVAGTQGRYGLLRLLVLRGEPVAGSRPFRCENPKTGQCVTPSIATTQNNTYRPLSRPLFIYAKGTSFKRPEVQAFLAYIFANEKAIATRARFVPADGGAAQAGADQLRPRAQGGEPHLKGRPRRQPREGAAGGRPLRRLAESSPTSDLDPASISSRIARTSSSDSASAGSSSAQSS